MEFLSFDVLTEESLRQCRRLKWPASKPGQIGADAAEMDFGVAPLVTAAIRTAVDQGALGYLSPELVEEVCRACASWQEECHGWAVSPDDVRLVPDVIRALHIAIERFSPPGTPVIVPVPAYMPFMIVPGLLGREIIEVEMAWSGERYVYDLDALDRAFTAGGRLLLLCNPHNPTGRVLERSELTAISDVVDRHGGRVFADEIHSAIVYPGHRHVPYASTSPVAAGHSLTAASASKAWNLAGLKCAQVILHNEADRERWARLGRLDTDGTSTLGAVASVAAYSHGQPWLAEALGYLDGSRRLLGELIAGQMPKVRYTPPEGTFLGWLDFRGMNLPGGGLARFFLDHSSVSLVDGIECGSAGRGFVRVNFAASEQILRRTVGNMAAASALLT